MRQKGNKFQLRLEMNFWESGFTPSRENSHLRDIYGIPDYVPSVEEAFRVKRAVLSWSVINLSHFPDPKLGSVFCLSPPYHLLETAWCLQLCPKAKVNGQRGVSLRLLRVAGDYGPEKVLASYRLGVRKRSNSVWFEAKVSTFWKGNFIQLNTSVLGYLEDFFSDGVNGATVLCEIYVSYFPTVNKEIAWEVSQVDESLPEDMSAMLKNSHSLNTLIEIRGHQTWADKSILSTRSKTLANRLEDTSFLRSQYFGIPTMLQLSCSLLCLKCVMAYIYTGSFDYMARNAYFSIGLYEIADELSLFPLRDLFIPHKKFSKSRIHVDRAEEVHKTQFDVRKFFSNTIFKIQGQRHKVSNLQVSIHIYKIGYLPNYFVGFKVEISGIRNGFHGETSLSVLDVYSRGVAARLLSQEVDPSGSRLVAIFVLTSSEFLSCDMARNVIFVRAAYKIYQTRDHHVRFPTPVKPPGRVPLAPWCWREQLAQDLKTLLQSGYWSDVSLMVEGRSFSVHRSIMAARSPFFYSLFYGGDVASDVYLISDVEPRIFWLVLNYVYCGTLSHFNDLTLEDFKELFRVSANYGLSSLVRISHLFIKMMSDKGIIID